MLGRTREYDGLSIEELLEVAKERGLVASYEKAGDRYTVVRGGVESSRDAISARPSWPC